MSQPRRYRGRIACNLQDVLSYQGDPATRAQELELTRDQMVQMWDKMIGLPIMSEHGDVAIGRVLKPTIHADGSVGIEYEMDDTPAAKFIGDLIDGGHMKGLSLKHNRLTLEPIEVSVVWVGARENTGSLTQPNIAKVAPPDPQTAVSTLPVASATPLEVAATATQKISPVYKHGAAVTPPTTSSFTVSASFSARTLFPMAQPQAPPPPLPPPPMPMEVAASHNVSLPLPVVQQLGPQAFDIVKQNPQLQQAMAPLAYYTQGMPGLPVTGAMMSLMQQQGQVPMMPHQQQPLLMVPFQQQQQQQQQPQPPQQPAAAAAPMDASPEKAGAAKPAKEEEEAEPETDVAMIALHKMMTSKGELAHDTKADIMDGFIESRAAERRARQAIKESNEQTANELVKILGDMGGQVSPESIKRLMQAVSTPGGSILMDALRSPVTFASAHVSASTPNNDAIMKNKMQALQAVNRGSMPSASARKANSAVASNSPQTSSMSQQQQQQPSAMVFFNGQWWNPAPAPPPAPVPVPVPVQPPQQPQYAPQYSQMPPPQYPQQAPPQYAQQAPQQAPPQQYVQPYAQQVPQQYSQQYAQQVPQQYSQQYQPQYSQQAPQLQYPPQQQQQQQQAPAPAVSPFANIMTPLSTNQLGVVKASAATTGQATSNSGPAWGDMIYMNPEQAIPRELRLMDAAKAEIARLQQEQQQQQQKQG
jgi:hypothetical protein